MVLCMCPAGCMHRMIHGNCHTLCSDILYIGHTIMISNCFISCFIKNTRTLNCFVLMSVKYMMAIVILIALYKTAVTPLLMQWSYSSLAISHRDNNYGIHYEDRETCCGDAQWCFILVAYSCPFMTRLWHAFMSVSHGWTLIWFACHK